MKLFDQTEINGMKMKNRFFKAATWEALADEAGHMTDNLFRVYEELAAGGVGTILTGYAHVVGDEQPNPGMMGIYDDSFIEEYKRLTDMVHQNNTNIILQIAYGGSMSTMVPVSKRILGASAVENERTKITPIAMTKQDILEMEDAFAEAALRAKRAGFDGVEVHAAHGYLYSSFLTPYYNRRTDEYGGNIENRARIITETITRIREKVGATYPVLIKMNSEDFMENGLASEESIEAGLLLQKAGIDAIEVSGSNESSVFVCQNNLGPARIGIAKDKAKASYFAEHAKKLAERVDIPVILTGGNRHTDFLQSLLDSSRIAYFGIGRAMICEPDLIRKWETGEKSDTRCVSCNGCYGTYGKRCVLNQR